MAKKKQKLPEKKSGIQTIHIILALLVIRTGNLFPEFRGK